jgi:hypothetical protein
MIATLLLAALLPVPSASAQAERSAEETILSLEKGAMERWRHGDPMGWAEISAPEVTYVDPDLTKPIVGLEEYTAYLKRFMGSPGYQLSEFLNPKVVVIGAAAILTYNYRSAAGNKKPTLWNTTEVYFQVDGKWRIAHTHWSFVRHRPPASVEVPVPVESSPERYTGVLGEVMARRAPPTSTPARRSAWTA